MKRAEHEYEEGGDKSCTTSLFLFVSSQPVSEYITPLAIERVHLVYFTHRL